MFGIIGDRYKVMLNQDSITRGSFDIAELSLNDGSIVQTTENTLKVFLDYKCRMSIEKIEKKDIT